MSNEIDAKRLIDEVRKRPALWDLNHEHNKSYTEVGRQWKELAAVLGVEDVEQCRRKWKNLRDSYRALVKRCDLRRARDEALGIYDPQISYESKWTHFHDLSFIRDKKRKRRTRFEIEQDQNTNSTDDCNHEANVFDIKVEPTSFMDGGDQEVFFIEEFDDDDADMTDLEFQDIDTLLPEQQFKHIPAKISVINGPKTSNEAQKTSSTTTPPVIHSNEATTSPSSRLPLPLPPAIKVAILPKETTPTLNNNDNNTKEFSNSSRSEKNVHFLENLEREEHKLMQSTREDIHRAIDHSGDPDYNFLVSFLPHMKKMNDLQNLQMRARMSDLVLNILSQPGQHQAASSPAAANSARGNNPQYSSFHNRNFTINAATSTSSNNLK
ncbi:uncharacterized protein LOC131804514 [Musca domestica]|uniref:Uncharacterized protein LOC131804514 n=1 Tax=Musca domestica TaxID=7370 RepID=A0ABM3VCG3_MUSDO|nr:uncharacterized protein LOC131804514 [Musca domestica]